MASYVGISRLQENMHYLSDFIAGAIVGTYVFYKIINRKDGIDNYRMNFNFGLKFIIGSPGVDLSLSF